MTYTVNNHAVLMPDGNNLVVYRAFSINGKDYDVTIADGDFQQGRPPDYQATAYAVTTAVQAYFKQAVQALGAQQFDGVNSVYTEFDKDTRQISGITAPLALPPNWRDAQLKSAEFIADISTLEDPDSAQMYAPAENFTLDHATRYLCEQTLKPNFVSAEIPGLSPSGFQQYGPQQCGSPEPAMGRSASTVFSASPHHHPSHQDSFVELPDLGDPASVTTPVTPPYRSGGQQFFPATSAAAATPFLGAAENSTSSQHHSSSRRKRLPPPPLMEVGHASAQSSKTHSWPSSPWSTPLPQVDEEEGVVLPWQSPVTISAPPEPSAVATSSLNELSFLQNLELIEAQLRVGANRVWGPRDPTA